MRKTRTTISLSLLLCLGAGIGFAQYSGISPEAFNQLNDMETGPIYVNTKAPGVHKVYDSGAGAYVWKDATGNYLCQDKNMKPLEDIDKDYNFTGINNDTDNPQATYNVHKEWDEERGCFVWKDDVGNFLGCDKPSAEKQEEWLEKKDENWLASNNIPQGKIQSKIEKINPTHTPSSLGDQDSDYDADDLDSDDEDYDEGGGMPYDEFEKKSASGAHINCSRVYIRNDEELARAEAAMEEVRNAIAEVQRIDPNVDINDYIDARLVRLVENAIKDYKRKHHKQ